MKRLIYIFSSLLLLLIVSCSGSEVFNKADPVEGVSVGTIITNPKPPAELTSTNIFPEFKEQLPGLQQFDSEKVDMGSITALSNIPVRKMLRKIYNVGTINELDVLKMFASLTRFGSEVQNVFNTNALSVPVLENAEIQLEEAVVLLNYAKMKWIIKVAPELNNPEYTRLYFINPDTNDIQASYVYMKNDAGDAVKGMLGFVNPKVSHDDSSFGTRVIILTYDFSNNKQNLFNIRLDRLQGGLGPLVAQKFMQCDVVGQFCIGEEQSIISRPPERVLDTPTPRYLWHSGSNDICFGEMDYRAGIAEVKETVFYTGSMETIAFDACTLPKPIWGDHVFTPEDLFVRVEDTLLFQSAFDSIFGDGQSIDSWFANISPDYIDLTFEL
jgi:hypothetical protein